MTQNLELQNRIIVMLREAEERSRAKKNQIAKEVSLYGLALVVLALLALWFPHRQSTLFFFTSVPVGMILGGLVKILFLGPKLNCPECGVRWTRRSVTNSMHCGGCAQYLTMRLDPEYKT